MIPSVWTESKIVALDFFFFFITEIGSKWGNFAPITSYDWNRFDVSEGRSFETL